MSGEVLERVFSPNPVAYEAYREKFAAVREGLARGDSFLLNLTVATGLETDWTLEEIFHRAWFALPFVGSGAICLFLAGDFRAGG